MNQKSFLKNSGLILTDGHQDSPDKWRDSREEQSCLSLFFDGAKIGLNSFRPTQGLIMTYIALVSSKVLMTYRTKHC